MSERQSHNKSYTLADIEQYLLGRLSPAEMHAIEKAAIMDPLLADAIEGYRYAGADASNIQKHLFDIRRQLLNQQETQHKTVAVKFGHSGWWRIAAAVLVLAGIGSIGFYMLKTGNSKQEIAQQNVPVLKKDTHHLTLPAVTDTSKVQPATVPQAAPLAATAKTSRQTVPANPEPVAAAPVKEAETAMLRAARKADSTSNALALADITHMETLKEVNSRLSKSEARAAGIATNQKPTDIVIRGAVSPVKNAKDSVPDLSEMVVTGYKDTKAKKMAVAISKPATDSLDLVPEPGWENFNAYFAKENGPDIHGEIVATIVLDNDGKAKDLTIIRSFNRSLDPYSRSQNRKFKKIILAGPVWLINGDKKAGSYRLEIEF